MKGPWTKDDEVKRATTTINLNQAAGTYDLFTGTKDDALLVGLLLRCPNEACGGSLTSISIQTDDETAQTILSSTDGAVANLTAEAQLAWEAARIGILIKTGTKIQLTINGGAHGTSYVCEVIALYQPVGTSGYLA